ncbi:MAG: helix-turn-helix domain-containing protein [Burkholderiaceae bacterium]
MATSKELIQAVRAELRAAGLTYADLARDLGSSESTIKRMFSRADMSLSRLDQILRILHIDLNDLHRRMASQRITPNELSHRQEQAVVSDRRLMLVAICCQSEWSFEQILHYYRFEQPELIKHMTRLDKIGLIELRAQNRYSLKLAKGFRWRPNGPVMDFFRERAMADYFSGGFDGNGEALILVHGTISSAAAPSFSERLQRLAQDFSRQHLADHSLADEHRRSYTLVLGMRDWLFSEFSDLVRSPAED